MYQLASASCRSSWLLKAESADLAAASFSRCWSDNDSRRWSSGNCCSARDCPAPAAEAAMPARRCSVRLRLGLRLHESCATDSDIPSDPACRRRFRRRPVVGIGDGRLHVGCRIRISATLGPPLLSRENRFEKLSNGVLSRSGLV